jgi:hypothetical protein
MIGRSLILVVFTSMIGGIVIVTGAWSNSGLRAESAVPQELECVACEPCPGDASMHIAIVDENGVLTAPHEAECLPVHYNACINAEEHGTCRPNLASGEEVTSSELVSRVNSAVATADAAAVSELIRTVPYVRFVPERRAIQVEACDRTLIAHVPLSDELADVLAAE